MSEETPKPQKNRFVFKEWHRTVLLLILLVLAIGFIIWSDKQYQTNFTNQL